MLTKTNLDSENGRVIGIDGTNMIVTTNWNNILVLGEIFLDATNIVTYK